MAGYTLGIKTDRQQKLKNAQKDTCLTPQDFSVKRKKAGVSTNRDKENKENREQKQWSPPSATMASEVGAKPIVLVKRAAVAMTE